jgi:hypothetical protein
MFFCCPSIWILTRSKSSLVRFNLTPELVYYGAVDL